MQISDGWALPQRLRRVFWRALCFNSWQLDGKEF